MNLLNSFFFNVCAESDCEHPCDSTLSPYEQAVTLADGCAYLGSQAVLILFGWGAFYVFAYTGVFFLLWDTTSR